ncbi:superoxide dismutase family protein [Streptomyces soliscabiei]|uniref:superoxide dismutase family protein n=1 Tax=Streptomyces soliscabiei TaxID=588897 RepID=UPI0029A42D45|nr:superoxide dismutase family protein [Streptomyces sp. NY05-11A]MDX2681695.1 superoxide dismutase family protein [Streptomyces sp. NY05-11A]
MPVPTSSDPWAHRRPVGRPRPIVAGVLFVAASFLVSGCGGDSADHASAQAGSSAHASSSAKGMEDMEGMSGTDMGDPSATPADKIPGATVAKGAFTLLDTRPPGMDDVEGAAWLAQSSKGTTVTVSLAGLKPGASYMAHLHAQHCSAGNGGEHFQFEKGGATTPPNEVHLMFIADKSGRGMTTVNNSRKTGEDAVAIVVHPSEAQDNRIACADFDF